MDPTVGAQYRWSARFAPRWPEFWGLMQGWITVFAWMANIGGSLIILSNITQSLIQFHNEEYQPKGWHTTVYMWAFIVGPVLFNLFLRRTLNWLENITGIFHVLFWFLAIIILATMSERTSTDFVFKTLTRDVSGWSNPGVAWSVGLLTTAFPIQAFDGVLHMSKYLSSFSHSFAPFGLLLIVSKTGVSHKIVYTGGRPKRGELLERFRACLTG